VVCLQQGDEYRLAQWKGGAPRTGGKEINLMYKRRAKKRVLWWKVRVGGEK